MTKINVWKKEKVRNTEKKLASKKDWNKKQKWNKMTTDTGKEKEKLWKN